MGNNNNYIYTMTSYNVMHAIMYIIINQLLMISHMIIIIIILITCHTKIYSV